MRNKEFFTYKIVAKAKKPYLSENDFDLSVVNYTYIPTFNIIPVHRLHPPPPIPGTAPAISPETLNHSMALSPAAMGSGIPSNSI